MPAPARSLIPSRMLTVAASFCTKQLLLAKPTDLLYATRSTVELGSTRHCFPLSLKTPAFPLMIFSKQALRQTDTTRPAAQVDREERTMAAHKPHSEEKSLPTTTSSLRHQTNNTNTIET